MKLFIQASAEADLLRQFEWFVEQGLPDIALQFRSAVREAFYALVSMPGAGAPRHIANSQLAGLRTWQVKGFAEFRVYYLPSENTVTILRILHGKRDVGSILEDQSVEQPGPN